MRYLLIIISLHISLLLTANPIINSYIEETPEYKQHLNKIIIANINLKQLRSKLLPGDIDINTRIYSPIDLSNINYQIGGELSYSLYNEYSSELKKLNIKREILEFQKFSIYNSIAYSIEALLINILENRELEKLYIESLKNEESNLNNIEKIFNLGELSRNDLNRAKLSYSRKKLELQLVSNRVKKLESRLNIVTGCNLDSIDYKVDRQRELFYSRIEREDFNIKSLELEILLEELENIHNKKWFIPDLTVKTGINYYFDGYPSINLSANISIPAFKKGDKDLNIDIGNIKIDSLQEKIRAYKQNKHINSIEIESVLEDITINKNLISEDITTLKESIDNIGVESNLGSKTIINRIAIEEEIFKYKELLIKNKYNLYRQYLKHNYIWGRLWYEK